MQSKLWKLLTAPALGALLLSGCAADDEGLLLPETAPAGGDLFARYVAMGQSNTAGYMSLGINDSTQEASYAVLLGRQAGGPFFIPELRMPGCPPPLLGPQPVTTARVGGGGPATCALRDTPFPPFVSNVAVPGSRIVDWVDNNVAAGSSSNALTTLILGGRTQLEAMQDANPTFVSVFPEGNEVLGAALAGAPALALPQAAFEAALDQIVAAIRDEGAEAAFLAMVDVPLVAPALQPGAYYFALQAAGQSPKPVSPTCAPGTPGGASLVAFSVLSSAAPTVSCAADAPGVLSPAEIADLRGRIAAYNAALRARAEANDWIYLDTNAVLATLLRDPQQVRKCQGLMQFTTPPTPAQFAQAVQTTCPGPTAPNFWGSAVSFDPVHFGPSGHRLFFNALNSAINTKYSLSIPGL